LVYPSWVLPLWAILAIVGVWIGMRFWVSSSKPIKLVRIMSALVLLSYAVLALIGNYQGGSNPLKPWQGRLIAHQWQNFTDVDEFKNALNQAAKSRVPVIVDWYANWCVSCKIIEREVFANQKILPKLNNYRLLRFDITDSNLSQRNLLASYGLFGPPAILFFNKEGTHLENLKIVGEINLQQFSLNLDEFATNLSI